MSFKFQYIMRSHGSSFRLYVYIIPSIFCALFFTFGSYAETIDRIIAVINDEVITLTDIKIAVALGLFEDEEPTQSEDSISFILKRMIDQRLVNQLSPGVIYSDNTEVEAYLNKLLEKKGEASIDQTMTEYGLGRSDLERYIKEKIRFQNFINQRFGQGVLVSLEEIEEFYQKDYVPSQQEKGLDPRPMVEILQEIESAVKKNKTKVRIQDWIRSLRRQAHIEIKVKDLYQYFKKKERDYEQYSFLVSGSRISRGEHGKGFLYTILTRERDFCTCG